MEEDNFGCGFCPKSFSNASSLGSHVETIHTSERSSTFPKIKSEVVNTNDSLMFMKKWLLNQKSTSHEELQDQKKLDHKSLSCNYCFKKFSNEFNAKRHEINKSCQKKFKINRLNECKYCYKRFSNYFNLKRHEINKSCEKKPSIEELERTNECQYCSKRFSNYFNMKRHEINKSCEKKPNIEELERKKECKYCSKKFSKSSNLTRHEMNKSCEKPNMSKLVLLASINNLSIKKSSENKLNIQFLEKRLECDFCGKKFSNEFNTKRHEINKCCQKESKIKRLNECQYCSKTFSNYFNVKRHEMNRSCEKKPSIEELERKK